MKPRLTVLYHFYYPDTVVSACIYRELSEDLAVFGWEVEVWPSNRSCRRKNQKYPALETYKNVQIKRVWRPDFKQESSFGRIFNSMWMICAWFLRFLFNPGKRPQVVLIGTDPVLGLIASIGIRAVDPKVKIAHWCFDLYPEAAAADKKIKDNSWGYRFLNWMMNCAYRACDLIVDLGSCMRQRLEKYSSNAVRETLTPWAFYEPAQVRPADPKEKCNLFGDASLGILYSGSFGLAHSADLVGQLACGLAAEKIRFSFSIRGHGEKAFRDRKSVV